MFKRVLFFAFFTIYSFSLFAEADAVIEKVVSGEDGQEESLDNGLNGDTESTTFGNSSVVKNPSSDKTGVVGSFFKTAKNIFFFALVVVIIFLLARLLKKFGAAGLASDDLIEVVSTKQLAGSRYLHIVKLGNEYSLIGSSDGGITLLNVVDDKETIDSIQLYKEKNSSPDNKSFREVLRSLALPGRKTVDNGQKLSESVNNLKKQRERLKKM